MYPLTGREGRLGGHLALLGGAALRLAVLLVVGLVGGGARAMGF